MAQINEWKTRSPLLAHERFPIPGTLKAQEVIEELGDLTADMEEETIITTRVGQRQTVAKHFVSIDLVGHETGFIIGNPWKYLVFAQWPIT